MTLAIKVALAAAAAAVLTIVVVDPLFTGNAWWNLGSIGSEAIVMVLVLASHHGGWLGFVCIFALLMRKHTHWLALSSIALTVFASAVVPGFMNALLLDDVFSPKARTTIFFYIWDRLLLLSLVLWVAYLIKAWLARRAASKLVRSS